MTELNRFHVLNSTCCLTLFSGFCSSSLEPGQRCLQLQTKLQTGRQQVAECADKPRLILALCHLLGPRLQLRLQLQRHAPLVEHVLTRA